MDIYGQAIQAALNGARVSVDFKKRSLRIDGKEVKLEGDLGIEEFASLDEWLDRVEDLYDDYKYSRPTTRSGKTERTDYFKAASVEELVAECGRSALSNGTSREIAKAALEAFILLSLVSGQFDPAELFAKDWFYQGADKSLIIRKDWF